MRRQRFDWALAVAAPDAMTAAAPVVASVPVRREASFRVLLGLFAIVPVCLAIAWLDRSAGGALRRVLPAHPDQILWFTLVFNVPHIVASHLLLFLDREYPRLYARWIGVAFALSTIPFLVAPLFLRPALGNLIVLVITMWHVLGQQAGITGGMLRTSSRLFPVWKHALVVSGIAIYLAHPQSSWLGPRVHSWLALAGIGLWVPTAIMALVLSSRAPSKVARGYVWANQLLVLSLVAFLWWGYPIFAVVVVRVVHDATAMYVYSVHDSNRNQGDPHNLMHRALRPLGLPSWAITILPAIAAGYLVIHALPSTASVVAVGFISMMHYVLEAVTWKRGSPHRASLPFGA